MANAIAAGKAPVNGCPVANKQAHEKIASIMGVTADESEKKVAHVMCQGCDTVAKQKYEYNGVPDCKAAAAVMGGNKSCDKGCLGFGNCKVVCAFDAIEIVDGLAVIDKDKCTSCGKCVEECPKAVIEFVPIHVKDNLAKVDYEKCTHCMVCVEKCPTKAIQGDLSVKEAK
ncbi:MAG: electron transporter RnfB [Sedimentibacter sp.]|nr:electron transporter RnfB [Sedimentibacter sp.]